MILKRPMLAAPTKEEDLRALTFPVLISAKLDGIRALCIRNAAGEPELVSRKLIRIPNEHCQTLFAKKENIGLDGELCVGPTTAKNLMQATTSGVMSVDGEPDVEWHVFDKWNMDAPYTQRAAAAKAITSERVHWVSQSAVYSYDEMVGVEEGMVRDGYEGAMIRAPGAPYKAGRSTVKQGWLLKIKRFIDGEAFIISCQEQMRNENDATEDNSGYTKRSTHKAGKVAAGKLGAFTVRDRTSGIVFDVGTGFTNEQRENLWASQQYLIGKMIKYKSFAIGVKDKPRFPTFVGFRDPRDV